MSFHVWERRLRPSLMIQTMYLLAFQARRHHFFLPLLPGSREVWMVDKTAIPGMFTDWLGSNEPRGILSYVGQITRK
jgi:hypothetical protein